MNHFYFNPFDPFDRHRNRSIFDVYDAGGYRVGVCAAQIEADIPLTIFDAQENKVGYIQNVEGYEGMAVYDAEDNYVGRVEIFGNIYDDMDSKVGKVLLTQEGTHEIDGVYLYDADDSELGSKVEALHVANPGSDFYHTEAAGAAFLLLLR